MQAMMQKRAEAGQKASKEIEAVLTSDQKAKVPAMLAELNALAAGGVPVQAVAELKLTADQKKKIEQIGADSRKQMEATNGDFSRFREINQAARDKTKAVLTPAQQAIVEKNRPRRGGMGGGRGGPGGAPGRPGAI
jgi:Spy/CpxP family protein refolding chaperone